SLYVTEPQIRLAEKLTAQSRTLKRAFFCNSGTEANEAMIKLARHYQVVNGRPDRIEILCFATSCHGLPLESSAATDHPKSQQEFGRMAPRFLQPGYGNGEQLDADD